MAKDYIIKGTVIDADTKKGIGQLKVIAFGEIKTGTGKKAIKQRYDFGESVSKKGNFKITASHAKVAQLVGGSRGKIFFEVFNKAGLLVSNKKDKTSWSPGTQKDVVIKVETKQEKPPLKPPENNPTYEVKGTVHLADGAPVTGIRVSAFEQDLRSEESLGKSQKTDERGFYKIQYTARQFRKREKGSADLVVKAYDASGLLLVASPVMFNAPPFAEVDLTIPAEAVVPPTLFERISQALEPLIGDLKIVELQEDETHQDVSFLSGETGFEKDGIARFILSYKLAAQAIQPQFWFVLLGGSFYQFTNDQNLKEQLVVILDELPSLDARAVRKALMRGFNQKEIPESFREKEVEWLEVFLKFIATQTVSEKIKPTFVKLALEHASIKDKKKQEKFAGLFNEYKSLTPELLVALEKDKSFKKAEIADLRTSFQLAELTKGDFTVVKVIKDEFGIRQPEKIRSLAKKSEADWVNLVKEKHTAGEIKFPFEVSELPGKVKFQEAEVYGKTLERQFREAFPTTAFAGGLDRALSNGGTKGLRHAEALNEFLDGHENFEFLNTPVDDFFNNGIHRDFERLAKDESFRFEVKAIQRVFKLAPTFEAADALLADDIHSAQKVYRMGKTEFVQRYAGNAGFTVKSARLAWNRAADTHAAVLTVIGDLNEFDAGILPGVLKSSHPALENFPNWKNLFKAGDLCECEHCRSVLSPAAYFADILMFLKDRKATNPANTVKDILFRRRPDLGSLELNCDNALTPLPYIDVVCEVLEDAVDATGENDLELTGFTAVPADAAAAKTAIVQAFKDAFADPVNDGKEKIKLGADFTLSQVDPLAPDRWIVHGDDTTYRLKKKASANFYAEILRNTKTSAAELKAYPQYVNPKAYEKLREAKYPSSLPFDLFAEDVRATYQKTNLQRWDLMRALRGTAAPNNATDGEIAAEYLSISADPDAAFDEKRLILVADPTVEGQQAVWGETGNAGWLDTIGKVNTFLLRTGLTYNDLLGLVDLQFINPEGDIAVHHLDASCDTDQKVIRILDAQKLDRIHRFLRLWRKLKSWKMWELDLVVRYPAIGNGTLDEPFLVQLFYFSQMRSKLGKRTTVEQVCALFDNLNSESRFTRLHKKREGGLYQNLFLNKRLIQPLDPAFLIDPGTGDLPVGETITAHLPVMLSALGIRETDLVILKELTKASDGTPYINNDDLTLANLSFLWRHTWLSKSLKFKMAEWKNVLKIFQQDILTFTNPQTAWEFLEGVDHLKATGFKPDELNWLLAADRSAKAATKEADTARFLAALRKELQAIRDEYEIEIPTNVDSLAELLISLLQKLNRNEAETQFFIATLRDETDMETTVAGLPPGFDFPLAITSDIRIRYDQSSTTLLFTGLMTDAERTTLLNDASLAAVTGIATYQEAIEALFINPRLALKFFASLFTTPLANLPAAVNFKTLPDDVLAKKISYDTEQRLLRFAGIMSKEQKAALDTLSADADYRNAVDSLFTQPGEVVPPDERIWLLDADLQFPLRDLNDPASDNLAENLATAATKALAYLSKTLSKDTVVQQSSAQLGLTEALTRRLLTHYAMLPDTLMTHITGAFAATTGVVDYVTLKTTFDGWFWASREAAIWNEWKITFTELEKITTLTVGAQLLDFATLPLDETGAIGSADRFLNTSRLLRLRDSLPETRVTLLELLENLSTGAYATAADFAADVERLNEGWLSADVEALISSLDLAYPADYLLAESWERLRRVFYFLDNLNASADTATAFAATAMTYTHAKTIKELLHSKFGTETWLTLSTEIQDVLRERKRDALTAYLLAQQEPADAPSGKWENTNDLYAYYLLDVEMSSCQLTSRLVQASGSVQLFVQRCFMGLEPGVVVKADGDDGDSAWRWWQWMRKYRVWEANRKVFLWPENWIEPELKKDRSPFFKDMENELLQNEINQTNVETAFTNYLEKLDGVAQLEIAGFYQEDNGDNTIIHVFGRTAGAEPHLYYYRRYDYRQWSPWEKVDLDIQGDYLIPAVVNQRLFLFWPIFTEVPDEEGNSTVDIPNADEDDVQLQKAKKRLRLQMAVSDYRQGKWTPKRVSKDFNESSWYDVEIVRKHYRFYSIDRSEVDGRFGIKYEGESLGRDGISKAFLYGAFEISGCKGVPVKTDLRGNFRHVIRPELDSIENRTTTYLKWIELSNRNHDPLDNDLSLDNRFSTQPSTQVLKQTPWIFKMTPPWHLSYLDKFTLNGLLVLGKVGKELPKPTGSWLSFYYNDKKRTFFVLPSLKIGKARNYYPEIKRSFHEVEEYFEGMIQSIVDAIDLSTLTDADRQVLEQFLYEKFSEDTPPLKDTPPSYTNEQVKNLIKRLYMRYAHLFLGILSLRLFQFRQFHFKNFYHPFVCEFAKLIYNPLKGIPALMSRETQLKNTGFSFDQNYQPTPWVVKQPTSPNDIDAYPMEIVDFSPDGAYSPYNWELFFHAPLLIANSLSKNQRFEEARDWYHFIFNPIGVESPTTFLPGDSPMRKYWITKPFFEATEQDYVQNRIDNILRMLAGDINVPGYSAQAKKNLEDQVLDWRTNPFEPHRIANYRTIAYQKTVVMKYLDNLIAWGDNLFRQDSMESINEATQLYILAAEILGPRPKRIPHQARPSVESFNELEREFDKFSNALVEVENLVPTMPGNGPDGVDPAPLPMLYFCIPQNDKMLSYWDTVADRLYKLRHCMNIEGVVRQLALFEPPIDPGALVKAVAGGVDISSAFADLNAPLPLYRFNVLLQKANEVCNDVKALGGALLAALEKKDAEALGLLRQGQETRVLEAVKAVRERQIEEAKENLDGMMFSKAIVEERRNYYRDIENLSAQEELQLDKLGEAHSLQEAAQGVKLAASIISILPAIDLGASGFGGSPLAKFKIGGLELGQAADLAADVLSFLSQMASNDSAMASSLASFGRRWNDWKLQERLAEKELDQVDKQIAAGELRIAIAEKELDNHVLQIENAKATDEFMRSKYTNEELYQWQVGQISGVYFQSYRLAYDLAKRAERCFRFELGLQDSSYINFGYWDSLKKGLLSGEKLQYDLRRLESAYLEQNRREFELNKNISLAMLDPLALVKLRETGRCFVNLPEEIFALDFPGHYFRRIKSVSLSLPCVVGPYTTISCTLRLLKNSIRINTASGDNGYPRNIDDEDLPTSDDRFIENNIPVKAIAASNAQNDSGVFELSFRDERYLPFEGAGAISEWSLELFSDLPSNNPDLGNPDFGKPLRQFDYNTISDAILHVKYTAREDAGVFKNGVITHLRDYFSPDDATPSLRMFNLRQEFPNQWNNFLHPTIPADGNIFKFEMLPNLFPLLDRDKTLKINTIWLLARCTDTGSYDVVMRPPLPEPPPAGSDTMTLTPVNQYGGLHFSQKDVATVGIEVVPTDPPVKWKLKMTRPGGGNLQKDPVKKVMEVGDVLLVLGYKWE